ncbi:MAG: FAD synthase [Methanocorpusculum sp.]|uniref:FAD synthase n=1 Tax=Methanocorpusculum petauri TaxID=3002863 RepID=A0ABT4IHD1_9EURY|nr:FAD synthase [Methanocorpusculum petauri]MDE2443424.1 FAD synthase [Methanocorpusculum sp.]MDE2522580.1 FAD synthase [Methanocorpusculum sp.]MDE2524459.1 FAD synthase [Methanocorpusculum sp.]
MRRVVATGTFDILHPGHLFYLEESRKLGDELWVVVARERNVVHKPRPVVPEEQRLMMIAGLRCVDHAILGDMEDMFRPIAEIDPEVVTLGFNQGFSEERLVSQMRERGIRADVVRVGPFCGCTFNSSRKIIEEALRRRGSE